MAKKRARVPGTYSTASEDHDRAFVRIEGLSSSSGIFHVIGARLWPSSFGNPAVAFPIHFVTSTEREAEVVAALERNEAPPERETAMPADFVELETEEARRQAEPIIAISGAGWVPQRGDHRRSSVELGWDTDSPLHAPLGVSAKAAKFAPEAPFRRWNGAISVRGARFRADLART